MAQRSASLPRRLHRAVMTAHGFAPMEIAGQTAGLLRKAAPYLN